MVPEQLKEHAIVAALAAREGEAIIGGTFDRGEISLEVAPHRIVEVCRYVKQSEEFNRLASVTAVDWAPREPRFEVVYHLHSLSRNLRLRLKCWVSGELPEIDSVTGVWRAANWYEREMFDLFGITFRNHPNLERIMMPDDWEGHPLRKDYPIHGHRYSYQNE